jgi:hypothetical protein
MIMRRHAKVSIGPSRTAILTSGLLILVATTPVFAGEKDNSGTNPVNFTYDARFYSEMAPLLCRPSSCSCFFS